MCKEMTIRIAGEAGQGMQTIGAALCEMVKKTGLYLFANQDYMSRIRGGNNFFQIRISTMPVNAPRNKSDVIVALDGASVAIHRHFLNENGKIIADKERFKISNDDECLYDIPMYTSAKEIGGSDIFVNSFAGGLLVALVGIPLSCVEEVFKSVFSDKSTDVQEKNSNAAKSGYNFVKEKGISQWFDLSEKKNDLLLMNGNEAIGLGAIAAGCKFYSAYPMTPSTGIMTIIAHYADHFNIVVEQAEDEIAAVNMVIGASFAGARSMTATSGGGVALMTEGLSLAAMTETPLVLVDAQRPGPATGFPTRTEQADLDFLLYAGHGEFARVLYTPGTIEQAFSLTKKAFNMAEKYQIPVLIMTDQHLADSYRNIEPFDTEAVPNQRFLLTKEESKTIKQYKRYELNESGLSPRAVPSWVEDVMYADSDEHTEEGHITEDGEIRSLMVEKRLYKKLQALSNEIEKPETYNTSGAEVILIGYGSTYGVLLDICNASEDKKIGLIHLSQVCPFPVDEIKELLQTDVTVFSVENNAGAQLAKLIRRETGIAVNGSILKYDGRPFTVDELTRRISQEVRIG